MSTLLCARLWLAAMVVGCLIGFAREDRDSLGFRVAFVVGIVVCGGLLVLSFTPVLGNS